jgi:hypothetical protein
MPRVPVAVERAFTWLPPSDVAGAYAVIDAGQPASATPRRVARSMGERWIAALVRDARRGPAGDAGAADAVVRDALCTRAGRLFALGLADDALRAQALALWPLPADERAFLRVPAGVKPRVPPPYAIHDRASFLTSLEDGVRQAAAELWATQQREAAIRLLEHQVQRGDPLGLVQLAHFQAFDGDRDAALHTLAGLLPAQLEPEARGELEALRSALGAR